MKKKRKKELGRDNEQNLQKSPVTEIRIFHVLSRKAATLLSKTVKSPKRQVEKMERRWKGYRRIDFLSIAGERWNADGTVVRTIIETWFSDKRQQFSFPFARSRPVYLEKPFVLSFNRRVCQEFRRYLPFWLLAAIILAKFPVANTTG